jgi:hypothetical protein
MHIASLALIGFAALEPRLQLIILGMLKVAGGGLLGYVVVPLRRLEPRARTPIVPMLAVLALVIVAAALSLAG